ncbi:MAG: helix-turn-helix domain-containing protein [Steroidobacteraceae bacterium]|jgi:DNA-binding IclR family transcriptional regulator|nr:helix-turn-helix domain-containing protein [Steroidobacteraceae bacterium]
MPETARSVARIAALLELFERERRPLTSQEIGGHLAIPRSSLGTLLKSLVGLRWLAADRRRATYFPGARLARLTGWLQGEALLEDPLRDAVERLHQATGETVSVSAISDLEIEVLHVGSGDTGVQLVVQPGRRMPLWQSAVGIACLAPLPDSTVRSMHRRAERRAALGGPAPPPLAGVLRRVRAVRDAGGIAFADGAVVPGVAALAFGLPEQVGLRPLVLSVGGPAERVLAERMSIEAALRREAEALCGPAARVGGRRATRSDAPTARRARLPRSTRLRRR